MDHKEQSAADERLTTLALAVQQHCYDYFDGKLSAQEWLQLVVDAVQQHQAEAKQEIEGDFAPPADLERQVQRLALNFWRGELTANEYWQRMQMLSRENPPVEASEVQG